MVGGGCLVGGGSLAIHEMAGGCQERTSCVSYRPAGSQNSGTNRMLLAYRCAAARTAALLYCAALLLLWVGRWMGGGWWVHWVVTGGLVYVG